MEDKGTGFRKEDWEAIDGLNHHKGFALLRGLIEDKRFIITEKLTKKDKIANLEEIRYYQGELAAYGKILDWVNHARKLVNEPASEETRAL